MVRINLLPRDIIERRRWERYYPIIFTIAAIAFVVVLLLVVGEFLLVQSQRRNLQETQNAAQTFAQQAQDFAIFTQREDALRARAGVASGALTGRVDWARLANELSLVLPDEVWVTTVGGEQANGMVLSGNTPNLDPSSADEGYKSVAVTLVRLAALPELYDVWLTNASAADFPVTSLQTDPVVNFSIKSKVRPMASTTATSSAVPAPPSTTGN